MPQSISLQCIPLKKVLLANSSRVAVFLTRLKGEIAELAATTSKSQLVKKTQIDWDKQDNIFTLENILSVAESEWLIDRSEKLGYEQSTVYRSGGGLQILYDDPS